MRTSREALALPVLLHRHHARRDAQADDEGIPLLLEERTAAEASRIGHPGIRSSPRPSTTAAPPNSTLSSASRLPPALRAARR